MMFIDKIPYYIARALIITIVLEVIIAIVIGIKNKKDILNVVLVNAITNPFVTIVPLLINLKFGYVYRNIAFYILEILVVFIEGFIYKRVLKFKKLNYLVISLILNIASFGIGEIINYM